MTTDKKYTIAVLPRGWNRTGSNGGDRKHLKHQADPNAYNALRKPPPFLDYGT